MNDLTEDLDALFEEIAAQHAVAAQPNAAATESATVAMADATAGGTETVQEHAHVNSPMFDRLGHIVRQLHDSLRELGYDRSLSDIATEVTDAAGRLEYIATLTEQAANKVLNSIDEAMPVQDKLIENARDVEGRWEQLFDGKLGLEEFKLLAQDSRRFAGTVANKGEDGNHDGAGLPGHHRPDHQEGGGHHPKAGAGTGPAADRQCAAVHPRKGKGGGLAGGAGRAYLGAGANRRG
jgi:chemotaxis protein CheZ